MRGRRLRAIDPAMKRSGDENFLLAKSSLPTSVETNQGWNGLRPRCEPRQAPELPNEGTGPGARGNCLDSSLLIGGVPLAPFCVSRKIQGREERGESREGKRDAQTRTVSLAERSLPALLSTYYSRLLSRIGLSHWRNFSLAGKR